MLERSDHLYCDACRLERYAEQVTAFTAAGHVGLARLRAQGIDPSQSTEAKRKMGKANAQQNRISAAWDRKHDRPDPQVFMRDILPAIQGVPLSRLAAATGCLNSTAG